MKREFLLVLPIEHHKLGAVYPAGIPLPLHCTLMHWFTFEDPVGQIWLLSEMDELCKRLMDVELVSEAPALFGPNNDVPVHTLKRTESLVVLHNRVFSILSVIKALPQELKWIGAGWNPHVTDGDEVFSPGRLYVPSEIALVDRINGGDKTIRRVWTFEREFA